MQYTAHNALEQTLGWKKYLFAETNTAKSRQECVFDFDKIKIFGWGLFFKRYLSFWRGGALKIGNKW